MFKLDLLNDLHNCIFSSYRISCYVCAFFVKLCMNFGVLFAFRGFNKLYF
jgi:hypothetical protein